MNPSKCDTGGIIFSSQNNERIYANDFKVIIFFSTSRHNVHLFRVLRLSQSRPKIVPFKKEKNMSKLNLTSFMFALVASAFLAFSNLSSAESRPPKNHDFDKQMSSILEDYMKIQEDLAGDKFNSVPKWASSMSEKLKTLDASKLTGKHKDHYAKLPEKLRAATSELAKSNEIENARELFKNVSRPMVMWVSMTRPKNVYVAYCPMAEASWLQKSTEIRNPYFGSKMLTCRKIIPPAK